MSNGKLKAAIFVVVGLCFVVACFDAVLVTIRFMRPAQAEGAASTQPVVVTAAQPAGAAAAAPVVESIDKYYEVPADQSVICVDPSKVPAEARLAFYRKSSPGQAQAIPDGPTAMTVRWKNGKPGIWSMSFGSDVQLPLMVEMLLDVYPAEIQGDRSLLQVHGDLAYVDGVGVDKYVASMEQVMRAQFGAGVSLSFRDVEQTAVVFRGTWKFAPVKDASVPNRDGIMLYAALPYVTGSGGGSGKLRKLAGAIEGRMQEGDRKPVVFEAQGAPDQIQYFFNREDGMDFKKLLDHVSEQTGLKWTAETRAMRCLVIETK